jgi:hypothetical protein
MHALATPSCPPTTGQHHRPAPAARDPHPASPTARGDASRIPEASSAPPTPSPIPADRLCWTLACFLNGNLSLIEACEDADCSVSELYAWANSEWARERFAMIRALSKLRDELIQCDAVPQARQTLIHLATIANPAEPSSSRECRRKAANRLLAPAPKAASEPSTPSEPGDSFSRDPAQQPAPANPSSRTHTPPNHPAPPDRDPGPAPASPSISPPTEHFRSEAPTICHKPSASAFLDRPPRPIGRSGNLSAASSPPGSV